MSETAVSAARDEVTAPVAAPALGPGDDDPKSRSRGEAAEAKKALGPGDDDGTSDRRGTPAVSGPPAGPGDGPDAEFDMVAPPAAGPGAVDYGPRRVTLIPKKKAEPDAVAQDEPKAESPRRGRRTNT